MTPRHSSGSNAFGALIPATCPFRNFAHYIGSPFIRSSIGRDGSIGMPRQTPLQGHLSIPLAALAPRSPSSLAVKCRFEYQRRRSALRSRFFRWLFRSAQSLLVSSPLLFVAKEPYHDPVPDESLPLHSQYRHAKEL